MANKDISSSTTPTDLTAYCLDRRYDEIMQGLVTAGVFVALADGELKAIERDELMIFIDRQGFAPTTSKADIAEAFDCRVRDLEGRHCANVIVEMLRPLTNQSMSSIVVPIAQRVAAADRKIQPVELQALKLIRRIMLGLPVIGPEISMTTNSSRQNSTECARCGTVLISSVWSESTVQQDSARMHCPVCLNELQTAENHVGKKLPDELAQTFFPSLLIA